MARFMFTYKGAGKPDSPEEGQRLMKAWQAWVESVSDRVVIASTPLGPAKRVGKDSIEDLTESVVTNGFTALTAENLEEALQLAQSCPHTEIGQIDVREMFEMPAQKS